MILNDTMIQIMEGDYTIDVDLTTASYTNTSPDGEVIDQGMVEWEEIYTFMVQALDFYYEVFGDGEDDDEDSYECTTEIQTNGDVKCTYDDGWYEVWNALTLTFKEFDDQDNEVYSVTMVEYIEQAILDLSYADWEVYTTLNDVDYMISVDTTGNIVLTADDGSYTTLNLGTTLTEGTAADGNPTAPAFTWALDQLLQIFQNANFYDEIE